jgi:2-oxoglutarate dehydrogenase E2 component (dihydrolipoamide succinyltransferase)
VAAEIRVPRLAESISEAVLVAWLKPDGERVRADEPVATLETDKAAVEIASDVAGTLRHVRKVGDTVKVDDLLARVEESAAPVAEAGGTATPTRPISASSGSTDAPAPASGSTAEAARPRGLPGRPGMAPGSGAEPVRHPAAPTRPPEVPARSPAGPSRPVGDGKTGTVLSPAVRRMVEEFGLDPATIEATGTGGRLLKEDVQRYLESGATSADPVTRSPAVPLPPVPAGPRPAAPPAATPRGAASPLEPWREGEVERAVPMSRIRLRIAERLVQAQHTAAILTTFNEVDMTAVMDLRARFRDSFEQRHGVKLSYMSFFTRACVLALGQMPELNAEIRGTDIVYQRHVHMGIAVQTERGLVVPVVRHADQRAFAEIEREIARLAAAARGNRLTLDELAGGTFSISNGGVFGSLLSTPILNPPQSAILGMHKIEKRPVVVDDQIVVRPMMYLALSYDHRIVDGEQAVTFLVSIKQRLEDPERMLIDV